jgi:hypothetical protein
MSARFFVGAKDEWGGTIVAEIIEAEDFYAASSRAAELARAITPRFRITAVNEFPALCARGSELDHAESRDPALAGEPR